MISNKASVLLAIALCALGSPPERTSIVDVDRDGVGDTVWIAVLSGRDNSETHLCVRPGGRGTEYRTVKLACVQNFLSLIPLVNPASADTFYRYFKAVVADSLCQGFRYQNVPDNSLRWLLDSYSVSPRDSVRHYTARWGPMPADFSPYYTLVSRWKYPSLVAGLPAQLVHSERDSASTAALFERADEFFVVYYMHNHCLNPRCVPEPAGTIGDMVLLTTSHAVMLQREGACQWLFIADNIDRLRRPTVGSIVTTGRCLRIELLSVYETAQVLLDTRNLSYRVVPAGTQ